MCHNYRIIVRGSSFISFKYVNLAFLVECLWDARIYQVIQRNEKNM